jgi:tRNA A-37 threonylcarbamoyl transferase component Bud32
MKDSHPTCPQCGSPIPTDAPEGLCPACALREAALPTRPFHPGAPPTPAMAEVAAAFPELEVLAECGHGGMSVVFKARQTKLDRLVALKILLPRLANQEGFAERFTREARALARLNHPNIVAVHDFGQRGDLFYLLMEFVDGVNLRQAMRAGVTPQQALTLVPRICEALQFAHDHGVLHRDIKPENILLDARGTPKLADFGIAKLADDAVWAGLTASGAYLGTPAYMAPEQVEKPASVDHRADIYSLGVVLYEMLTGDLPLGRFAAPSSKASVGPGVDEVVLRALERERDRRQQSANEMKTQVEDAERRPAAPAAPPALPPWSRSAVAGVLLTVFSGPIGGLLFLLAKSTIQPSLASGSQLNGPVVGNILLFGAIFALVGVVLGWKAVSDLRLHRGYLRGGGCAVTAALLAPTAAVVLTIAVNFERICRSISPSGRNDEGLVFASVVLATAVGLSIWAFRALWRAVHQGPPGIPLPPRT